MLNCGDEPPIVCVGGGYNTLSSSGEIQSRPVLFVIQVTQQRKTGRSVGKL